MKRFAGLICLAVLAMSQPLSADAPAFDCAKSDSAATDAICASSALSALDREMTRLYLLALNGPHMTDARRNELKAFQRGWIKGRDACWKSDDLQRCVRDEYALRIHELREGYADARAEPGASTGPFAYACSGIDAGISAVFVTSGDPLVTLKWRNTNLILPLAESGSGSRYTDGTATFWIKGKEARFDYDGADHSCTQDDIG